MDLTNYIEIENFSNYKINKEGSIYSCKLKRLMKILITRDGYYYVDIIKDGKKYKKYIHRLLAIAFINNLDNKPEIDHIDRNKANNNLDNLRWVTRTENNRNKANYKDNLTAEQLEARKEKRKEYERQYHKLRYEKLKKINII